MSDDFEVLIKGLHDELESALSGKHDLTEVADIARQLGNRYSESGKIRGYVLDVNGVDAVRRVIHWPEHAQKKEKVSVVMGVKVHDGTMYGGRQAQINLELEAPQAKCEAPVETVAMRSMPLADEYLGDADDGR